jgi:hypothetical protein
MDNLQSVLMEEGDVVLVDNYQVGGRGRKGRGREAKGKEGQEEGREREGREGGERATSFGGQRPGGG